MTEHTAEKNTKNLNVGQFVGDYTDEEETLVIFRKYKDTKQILALFPEIDECHGHCRCYEHMGQHGSADYMGCVYDLTTWAKPEEYADLKSELEQIGYKLKVRRKWMRK